MLTYNPPRYILRRNEIIPNVKPGANFLEIGAGNLKLTKELLGKFSYGTIIDYSGYTQEFFNQLPNFQKEKLKIIQGDFLKIDIPNSFDCIVCCEVLEHVEDDSLFLEKIHSSLSRGGQLILSVPARMKYWSIHDETVGHLRRYEKDDLIELVSSIGFSEVGLISYGFPFIHLFRIMREILAKQQHTEKKNWSQRKQTETSGALHASKNFNWLGLLINPKSFAPLSFITRIFNRYNLSDGYILIAKKK